MAKLRKYDFVLYPIEEAGRMINGQLVRPAVDLGTLVKHGLLMKYEDAKEQVHEVTRDPAGNIMKVVREEDIEKIWNNAVKITILTPAGTITGPAYLMWKGAAYLMKRSRKKREEKYSKLEEE